MKYLIKNGHVVDPANKIDEVCDVLISDGKIEKVGKGISAKADEFIDAKGMIVAPGLVDMHVHLREPGREDEETVLTGTRAAIKGGYSSIACMPNTEPAIDNAAAVKIVKEIAARDGACNVFIIGAITEARAGKALTDFSLMKAEGVVGVSDDGSSVDDPALLEKALAAAKRSGLILIEHCEDKLLSAGGVINAGFIATKMGLRGISAASEYERVKRNIELAKKTGCPIHLAHISCGESVKLIRKAKAGGVKVTAETAPHYFALTDECCVTYDTNTKINPPLRTAEDVSAIKEGLRDGAIDAIASDHAPHTDAEKDVEFDFAPFGKIGLESSLGVSAMELVDAKILTWPALIEKMAVNPAKILGIKRGSIAQGCAADITIIDDRDEFVIEKDMLKSKSCNSPFVGWRFRARAVHVFVGGKHVLGNGD